MKTRVYAVRTAGVPSRMVEQGERVAITHTADVAEWSSAHATEEEVSRAAARALPDGRRCGERRVYLGYAVASRV